MAGRPRPIVVVLGVAWLVTVVIGMDRLWAYANTPGRAANAPVQWPAASHLARLPGRPTLVMLVHPQCSCSPASIEELSRTMAHLQGRLTAYVVFYRPEGEPAGWEKTDLWRAAESIPGVRVASDEGLETAAFGAASSGQVLLYDTAGLLVFSGGITFARGHAGDNAGRDAVEALVLNGASTSHQTPVFGCSIRGDR